MFFIQCNTIIGVRHGVPSSIVNCTLEALQGRSRFWDQTFSQAEFAKDDIIYGRIDRNSRKSSFEEGETDVGSQDSNIKICISRLIIKTSQLTLSVIGLTVQVVD